MVHWKVREALSLENRLRRSYYELLRDELDQLIIDYALLDSYKNFKRNKKPYPFAEKRELKPRAQLPKVEYEHQNAFLVIFVEDIIPDIYKKHIRIFDINKTTRTNLLRSKSLDLSTKFDRNQKYLNSARFFSFLKELLPLDYALLLQRDESIASTNRYEISHFHVRIDWPVADAAEDLGRHLRYISKDLYEKGEKHAEDLQKKLFEYYGFPFMAGGRRTAALVAAQFLRQLPCISTVYAASSEARHVTRISERGVSKITLVKLSKPVMTALANENDINLKNFQEHYVVDQVNRSGVCILQVHYLHTEDARVPMDKRIQTLNPAKPWLTVTNQYILPIPPAKAARRKFSPLPVNLIYSDYKE